MIEKKKKEIANSEFKKNKNFLVIIFEGILNYFVSYIFEYSKIKWIQTTKATKLATKLLIFCIFLGVMFYFFELLSIFIFKLANILPK